MKNRAVTGFVIARQLPWPVRENLFKQTPEETRVIVSYAGLRFVLARQSCINNEAPLDLITVLPPQK